MTDKNLVDLNEEEYFKEKSKGNIITDLEIKSNIEFSGIQDFSPDLEKMLKDEDEIKEEKNINKNVVKISSLDTSNKRKSLL